MSKRPLLLTLIAVCISGAALAQPIPGDGKAPGAAKPAAKPGAKAHGQFCKPGDKSVECGWFWGADFDEKAPEEAQEEAASPPPVKEKPEKEKAPPFLARDQKERCKHRETWDAQCGFQDPGKDWAFMKLQEEMLSQQMVLNSTSPWSVKQYQYFVLWAVDRVSEVAQVWSYNVQQDEKLNPNLRNITNRQGLRWASTQRNMDRKDFFKLIKEDGGFLVYWTRSDCKFCKDMSRTIVEVGKESGLPVWNASLDAKCEEPFLKTCMTAPKTNEPARFLQIAVVPALMLYMPKENSWLRIASGVDSVNPILSRMKLYAQGVRAAAIAGTKSDVQGQAAVDFSRDVNKIYQQTGFTRTDTPPAAQPAKK